MLSIGSIACKNNSTDNTPPKNYASLSLTSDSVTNLIAVSTANSENLKDGYSIIVIRFTDATSTTLSKAVDKDSKDVTIGTADDAVSYSSGSVTFGKNILTGLTSGTTNNYTLTFDVAGENTNAAISVVVGLTRATKLDIKTLFTSTTEIKSSGSGVNENRHKFFLKGDNANNTFEDNKATFKDANGEKYPMEISVITAAVQSEIDANFGTYFSQATIGTHSVSETDKSTLTVPLNLTTKPEYEFATTYDLEFVLYKNTTEKATGTDSNDAKWIE